MHSEIDWQTFDEIKALMEDGFNEFIHAFMSNTEMHIQSISKSIDTEDYTALRMSAHTIKSSARTLGFISLSNRAEHLEQLSNEYEKNTSSVQGDMLNTLSRQIAEDFHSLSPHLEAKIQSNF